ncbi:Methyltransferase-like protein 13 [Hondaea fermentalgiana]|uniref:Methyltransferase-like protein 13 n=1 Tax=Hondaea fermentalgiana TaxID=2315210 RepID=A0A2R5GXV3_9STRA|nr:Methyltransferase-like protein 13 [Hondaea fermentalgiana]|eukprot:GBG33261.1 Methyltransferase-like protein 13 [Hondaea fermentalgiana]
MEREEAALAAETQQEQDAETAGEPGKGKNEDEVKEHEPPADNRVYKTREYWEARFAREEAYEWLADYGVVAHLLEPVLAAGKKEGNDAIRVLVVGCGNSGFSDSLAQGGSEDDGDVQVARQVTSIDFSETVILSMRARYPDLTWETMDMRSLSGFADASFDFVVDKAAMDALVTDEGDPWNPNEETRKDTAAMMDAVTRVLVPGGMEDGTP